MVGGITFRADALPMLLPVTSTANTGRTVLLLLLLIFYFYFNPLGSLYFHVSLF